MFCIFCLFRPASTFAEFISIGPGGGTIGFLAVDPKTPQTIYAVSDYYGVYKSTNGGANWNPLNSEFTTYVRSLAIDPLNSQTIYAMSGGWILKSTDGGTSWEGLGSSSDFLIIDPTNSQTLYSRSRSSGVSKSTDGGITWRRFDIWANSLAIDPSNSQIIYATSDDGVYKSSSGGTAWAKISQSVFRCNWDSNQLVVDPSNPQTMYAGHGDGIYKSTDSGATWNKISDGPQNILGFGYGMDFLTLDPHNPQTIYTGNAGGLIRSTDGGLNWSTIITETRVKSIAFDPVDLQTIYIGTDFGTYGQGVFKSTNGGTDWCRVSSGLRGLYTTAVALDSGSPPTIYAGTSGGGIFRSDDNGANWTPINSDMTNWLGLSSFINCLVIDPVNTQIIYAGTQVGLFKSTNAGTSWNRLSQGFTELNILSLAIDPADPRIIYAGTGQDVFLFFPYGSSGVFKSTDGGETWNKASVDQHESIQVLSLAIAPGSNRGQTLYAATYEGVLKSIDGGMNWKVEIAGPQDVMCLAVDPTTAETVYAGTYSGVYKSANGGTSWTNISSDLPNQVIVSLIIDPLSPQTIFAGNHLGLFKKNTGNTAAWHSATPSFPDPGKPPHIELHPSIFAFAPHNPRCIYIGTGDGLYVDIERIDLSPILQLLSDAK